MTNTEPPKSPSTPDGTSASQPSKVSTIRQQLGGALSNISDAVNNNLIIIRYGTFGSIVLLGAYGIANTPLFYRYKSLWDIPGSSWRRKWIHGRIVGVLKNKNAQTAPVSITGRGLSALLSSSLQTDAEITTEFKDTQHTPAASTESANPHPIVILFRHSSPIERLLTQNTMEKVLYWTGTSPSKLLHSSSNIHRNLLPIELVGIGYPPFALEESLLNKLADEKTRVSIQLLAQRVTKSSMNSEDRIPADDSGTALCHVIYRKPNQWISTTSLNSELVKLGQAVITSHVVPESDKNPNSKENKEATAIINFNPTPKQLQHDATFMSKLEEAEYSAWKSKTGIWTFESMRDLRPEYKEEEKYVNNLWSTRLFNMLKAGWGWVRK